MNVDTALVQIIQIAVSGFGGGLAGAVLTQAIATRRGKAELAVKVMGEFIARYEEIAEAKYILMEIVESGRSVEDMNKVRKVLDWFEFIGVLLRQQKLDKDLSYAVIEEIVSLRDLAADRYCDARKLWPELFGNLPIRRTK